jgi:hypothetical protein
MGFPVFFMHDDPDDLFELVTLGGRQAFAVPYVILKNQIPCRCPWLLKNSFSSSVSEPVEHCISMTMNRDTNALVSGGF